jgi:type II secretory pathway pseudopilin PulG
MSRTPTFKWSCGLSARRQEGFTLAALLVLLTIIALVIAYTVPEQWSMVMGRERDKQTIFLMKQFARAIKAWNVKNNALPTSLDQLTDARRPRMIRGNGKWPCPITGKEDDWILVPPGAVQVTQATVPDNIRQYANTGANAAGTGAGAGPSTLNKEASPADYVGPFIAVRPKASGKSFITFKGAEDYSEWVYTVQDLDLEIQAQAAALAAK